MSSRRTIKSVDSRDDRGGGKGLFTPWRRCEGPERKESNTRRTLLSGKKSGRGERTIIGVSYIGISRTRTGNRMRFPANCSRRTQGGEEPVQVEGSLLGGGKQKSRGGERSLDQKGGKI